MVIVNCLVIVYGKLYSRNRIKIFWESLFVFVIRFVFSLKAKNCHERGGRKRLLEETSGHERTSSIFKILEFVPLVFKNRTRTRTLWYFQAGNLLSCQQRLFALHFFSSFTDLYSCVLPL